MDTPIKLDAKTQKIMRYAGLFFCLGSVLTTTLISKGYFPSDSFHWWAYYVSFPSTLVAGFAMVLWMPPTYKKNLLFIVFFHILSVLVLVFVAGFQPIFLLIWLLLIIGTDAYLGRRAGMAGFLLLFVSAIAWMLMHLGGGFNLVFDTMTQVVLVFVIVYVVSRIREVSALRDSELEVSREQERLERERLLALINSMGDAVIATNDDGEIRIYNGAALSLLDTNESLLGRSIQKTLNLRDTHKKEVSIAEIFKNVTGSTSRSDLEHVFKDGDTINLYMNVAPIHLGYQHSGERGYIFILRDITKEKSLEEERDEFISVVSHELRTPIAIAEGNLSNAILLKEHKVDPKMVDDAMHDAHEQILFLSRMANDLATLSRAERGKQTLEIEEVSATELLDKLKTDYLPEAEKKGLELKIIAEGKLKSIFTSKLYVQEILQNFLTNSIKYTKQGSVTVTAKKGDKGHLVFEVKDTGIGVSKADQKHLFEKFFRSEDYRTRESSGTGLGLYLVQKLAQQIHANIAFKSRLNFGSTFSIEIPSLSMPESEQKQRQKA